MVKIRIKNFKELKRKLKNDKKSFGSNEVFRLLFKEGVLFIVTFERIYKIDTEEFLKSNLNCVYLFNGNVEFFKNLYKIKDDFLTIDFCVENNNPVFIFKYGSFIVELNSLKENFTGHILQSMFKVIGGSFLLLEEKEPLFLKHLKAVNIFITNDGTKYTLNGVFLDIKEKSFIAINGKVLCKAVFGCSLELEKNIILSGECISKLNFSVVYEKIFYKDCSFKDGCFVLLVSNVYYFIKTLGGEFPNYKSYIPIEDLKVGRLQEFKILKKKLISVLNEFSSFERKCGFHNKLKWNVFDSEMILGDDTEGTLKRRTKDFIINIFYEGKGKFKVLFISYIFLLFIIKSDLFKDSKEIVLKVHGDLEPIVFTDIENKDFLFVLMPMKG